MKKIIVLLSLVSSAAFAGSISLDTRIDSDSATYNTANTVATPANKNYSKFYLQTGRVDFKGKAAEDLSYRLRLRFNESQTSVNSTDALNKTVDYAAVTHKMGDVALTFGKFDIMTAGFEGATSGADLYFKSAGYKGTSNGVAEVNRYNTGFNAAYTMGDHSLTLLVTDGTKTTETAQSRNMYALVYKGILMDKALNLLASYHTQNTPYADAGSIKNFDDAYLTVGAMYKMADWSTSLDYNSFSVVDTATAGKKDTTESIVLNGSYNVNEMTTVKAKIESSTEKNGQANDAKATTLGYGVAAEFKPVKDADFRYHVAYTNKDVKPETGDTQTESHIIAGIRLQADFLK